jgi:transposase
MSNKELAASMTQEQIVSLLASHADISLQYKGLNQERDQLKNRIDELQQQLDWFKRQLFGAKSERRINPDDSRQLTLGELDQETLEPATEPTIKVPGHERRLGSKTRKGDEGDLRFDDSVPVEQIILPSGIPAGELDDYEKIGEKKTRHLAQKPGSYFVREFIRSVYKKKAAADAIEDEIYCSPPPWTVFHRSFADVSLLAGILIDKFRYHLPLYRQHKRMIACGVHISRGTLTNWVHRTAELLVPIYEAQMKSILASAVLAMDETPIKAGRKKPQKKKKPPGRGKMNTAYFWPLYGDQDEVVFHFAPTRSHTVVFEMLDGYAGTLVTDGYEAYRKFAATKNDVCHAACWVHTRRGFDKALVSDRDLADQALQQIADLYKVEAELSGLALEKLKAKRALRSKPIVEGFFEWLRKVQAEQTLLPSSLFTKALAYALKREQALKVFLENPEVPLDTNHLERQIRPIAVGRKNWMFCWTEVGAQYAGIAQSLLSTCILHGVDPYTYLVDVLQRVETHPAAKVAELTPRLWKEKFAADPIPACLGSVGCQDGRG